MGESKHTPGWVVVTETAADGLFRPWLQHAKDWMPDAVGIEDPDDGVGRPVAMVLRPEDAPILRAAPQMLEALRAALPDLEAFASTIGYTASPLLKVRAAIKAATGGASADVCDASFREPGGGGIRGRCVGPKGHRTDLGPTWSDGHSSDPRMFPAATGGET